MSALARWAETVPHTLGGPGLFVVALLDSSVLSLPHLNDLLLMWMVLRRKERLLYYAAMATLGSLAGCLIMYGLGRRGGEAVLRHRVRAERVDRALAGFARYGVLAVLVPALLPPPAPFKLFILLAGVARVPVHHFTLAVALGRGLRYLTEGALAAWYGDQALAFVRDHGAAVSLSAALLVLVGGLASVLWHRRHPRPRAEGPRF